MDFTQISTENLVKQMKLQVEDTKKRTVSSSDVYTSGEVKRENVQLAKKNLKEIEKMLIVLTKVRDDFSSSQRACTLETQLLFNDLRDQVSDTAMKVFGNDDWEISSLVRAYDHLHTSTESLVAEEAVDSRGLPDWVAENCVDTFLPERRRVWSQSDPDRGDTRIIFRIGEIVNSGTPSVEQ